MSDTDQELGITWEGGGAGRVIAISGETITVRSSKPFAPGSRPDGRLGTGEVIRLKSHRCRREESADGLTFTVEGRTLDMPRALRVRLEARFAPQA